MPPREAVPFEVPERTARWVGDLYGFGWRTAAPYTGGLRSWSGRASPVVRRRSSADSQRTEQVASDAGTGVADLAAPAVLTERRAAGYREFLTAKALAPLLGYLRGLDATPQPGTPAPPKTWGRVAAGTLPLLAAVRPHTRRARTRGQPTRPTRRPPRLATCNSERRPKPPWSENANACCACSPRTSS